MVCTTFLNSEGGDRVAIIDLQFRTTKPTPPATQSKSRSEKINFPVVANGEASFSGQPSNHPHSERSREGFIPLPEDDVSCFLLLYSRETGNIVKYQ